ncbi:RNA-binding protein MRN1 [Rhodotorula toruloides]|uniref:BY PROTMAP: gi/472586995/gb/EMS24494.1/ differentiation regulator, Nrd1 [Rhodosporidium toruloides NP11] gi/647394820/emb/CDR36054.1/ RHTO0S01e13190g1_1 [Rhodosporidium toruloides] n=1 Tax=Rhodotorula toruloides TaxID=5286 RepID=A0A0K3CDQ9_RHOTO|nr:RNA-binding protein MRN1 [Rhodotorula toruloides]
MPGEKSTLYSSFPPTSFAAAAAGAGSNSSNPTVAPSGSQADLGVNGTADFEAMKRSFEGAGRAAGPAGPVPAVNGVAGVPNGAPNPSGAPYQDVYGGAAPAAFAAANGMYGAPYGGAPEPFIPGHQAQQASTSGAAIPPAGTQNGAPVPANGTFSNATSPYLAAAGPNGAVPGALPFVAANGAPQPGVAGGPTTAPYAGSAFDQAPGSPNPYGGPTPAPGGGPAPFGSPVPGQFGGLGIGSPFMGMMSPMLGMGSPQLGGGNGFGMPYPIGGTPQPGMGGMGAGMGATQTPTTRTVYVGNLPSDASVDELLSQVRFGPIESIRILPEKSCAFISFLDPTTAAAFHSDALMRKIRLHDHDLKIGWGKPSAVSANVLAAVQQSGATRNVYIGNLDESVTEETLRDDLSRFGPIDQVKIVRDKNIGFVHFLSIATAIKVVQNLPQEPAYAGRRVAYGKDRTAYVPKNQHQQQQHNMAAAAMGSMAANYGGFGGLGFGSPQLGFGQNGDPNAQMGNRTIYLGNIHPEVTTEEICNIIRGGILEKIRYIPDKHICFVTFVDPHCALAFFQMASFQGIALHNRRLKVGWGKQSGPTSPGIAMVVQAGGSRNVYVGNIDDFETYKEEKLRKDFGEYGEIELVNFLKEKQCCFVNFTNITNAIKAIEGIKQHADYQNLKVSYGKDRCGGAPRAFRGFDLRNQQRGPRPNQDGANGSAPSNGYARSPFPDVMSSFPTSPLQTDQLRIAEGGETQTASPQLPEIGALVLDEEAAAAAGATAAGQAQA